MVGTAQDSGGTIAPLLNATKLMKMKLSGWEKAFVVLAVVVAAIVISNRHEKERDHDSRPATPIVQATASILPTPSSTPTLRESIQKELDEGYALMAENAKYLRLVESSWKFDESHRHVVWTVTIENKSDAPIGNIIFSTRYADRHGNVLQFHNGENADEANRLDLGIDGPVKAHSRKTFTVLDDITEPMVILDAEKASFTIVAAGDWTQRVVK
jgi:hypothetical protein